MVVDMPYLRTLQCCTVISKTAAKEWKLGKSPTHSPPHPYKLQHQNCYYSAISNLEIAQRILRIRKLRTNLEIAQYVCAISRLRSMYMCAQSRDCAIPNFWPQACCARGKGNRFKHAVDSWRDGELRSIRIGSEEIVKELKVKVYCSCRKQQERRKMAQCIIM